LKIIVGLGNPGAKYASTRHNVGFRAVDRLAQNLRAEEGGRRWAGVVAQATLAQEKIYILKPQTYMNNSGRAVAAAVKDLNPDWEDILIVFDDLALPLGTLRFRNGGSAGGQKGMASILQTLGHQQVPRLRLGIGVDTLLTPREFVLRPFNRQEHDLVEEMIHQAAQAMELWIRRGIIQAMSQYNGPVRNQ